MFYDAALVITNLCADSVEEEEGEETEDLHGVGGRWWLTSEDEPWDLKYQHSQHSKTPTPPATNQHQDQHNPAHRHTVTALTLHGTTGEIQT